MKISNKQRRAIEKISGRHWNTFSPLAIDAYFAFTDRGELRSCDDNDFVSLMHCHRFHPVIVEMWKEDFKKGLLFLWDFLLPEYPIAYIKHAFEIYESAVGFIPSCYLVKFDEMTAKKKKYIDEISIEVVG